MVTREINNYVVKAQSHKELDLIQDFLTNATYTHPDFKTYFHVWSESNTRIFYFIKEKYFISRDGVTNYPVALMRYARKDPYQKLGDIK